MLDPWVKSPGSFESPPARRFRGASPHRLYSYAKQTSVTSAWSWHTQKISFRANWISLLEVDVASIVPAPPTADPSELNNELLSMGELKLE
jgi:hypothetical protein